MSFDFINNIWLNFDYLTIVTMNEQTFQLKAGQPYIELNKLLKIMQLAQTGGHAKIMIQNEEVMVNDLIETRVRKKLVKSDHIKVDDQHIKIL